MKNQIAVGGPDGFLVVLPSGPEGRVEDAVEMKGHVGDVLDVKWFPSGEVSGSLSAFAGDIVLLRVSVSQHYDAQGSSDL